MEKKLIVVTGPSGAGIREVIAAAFARRPDFGTVTPVTARKMKDGEVNGVGFWFFDLDGWNALKESGDLLESTELAGNDYGTSRRLVREQLAAGRHVLMNLDPARAAQLKRNMPEAVCVYLEPSEAVLRERYQKIARSTLELSVRLETAKQQRESSGFCDCHICSDDPEAAVSALCALPDR